MQALVAFFLLALPLLQRSLAERALDHDLANELLVDVREHEVQSNETTGDKKPGEPCSSSSWCTVYPNSRVFCGKRRGGDKRCYIYAGKEVSEEEKEWCTVPGFVADGKCAQKGEGSSCEEDSDCGDSLACSDSTKTCKRSCAGKDSNKESGKGGCPACPDGSDRAPIGASVKKGSKPPHWLPSASDCPNCCGNNGNADKCCKWPAITGGPSNKHTKGCKKTLDSVCIDNVCEYNDMIGWQCMGKTGNVGQL